MNSDLAFVCPTYYVDIQMLQSFITNLSHRLSGLGLALDNLTTAYTRIMLFFVPSIYPSNAHIFLL